MRKNDITFIKTALSLARKGQGNVEPNPMVGAVIVKNGKIIGKGYHKKFGQAHAEIEALENCKASPAGATMYVTLEPCCHFGKTPPCTDAIIKAGIRKVAAAVQDPTKKVAGKGFKILRKAGIEVESGICLAEAIKLNAPFFKFAKTKKPWVIIKWAQSKDGFLSRTDGKRWITNSACRKDVQKLRKRTQAILVGVNTVIEDDPMLTVRLDTDRHPLRVVLDSNLRIPLNSKLIKTANKYPVCIFTKKNKKIKVPGVETINAGKKNFIKKVLTILGRKGIQQLLVEGGEKIITSFIRQNLADEIVIYTSSETLGKKGKVRASKAMNKLYNTLKRNYDEKKLFNGNIKLRGFVNENNGNFRSADST